MVEIKIVSDLDNYNNTDFSSLILNEYYDICEYSKFNIEIIVEPLACCFSGSLDNKNVEEIENFLNLVNIGEKVSIAFNGGNGSAIAYDSNKVIFSTYSYKEGDFIETSFCINIESNDTLNKMIEVFNKILYIRKELDKIRFVDDLEEDENYEEQPEDDNQSQIECQE